MNRLSFASLRIRLFMLVLLAIVPMCVLIIYTGIEERQRANDEARQSALALARQVADEQAQLIENGRQLLLALSQLPEMRNYDDIACNSLLADLTQQFHIYRALGATKTNGDVFCYTGAAAEAPSLASEEYFQRAAQALNFALSAYRLKGAKPTLIFIQPIVKDDILQGAMFAEMDLSWVGPLVARNTPPPGATVSVFNGRGSILAYYPETETRIGRLLPESPIAAAVGITLVRGSGELRGDDGLTRLYGFLPMGRAADAYVNVGIPVSYAYAEANAKLMRNLILLGAVSLLTLVAAWVGSSLFVLRQINALVNATRRLSDGDWKTRSGLAKYQGELGELAQSFDKMAAALENRDLTRRQAEETLRETRNQLNQQIKERNDVLLELDEEMKRLEAQMQAQHLLFQHVTAHINEPAYRTDALGNLTFCNRAFLQLVQYDEMELKQTPYWALTPESHQADVRQYYETQAAQRRPHSYHEAPFKTQTGQLVWLGQFVQLMVERDRVVGWQAIARDITAQKMPEPLSVTANGAHAALLAKHAVNGDQ